MTNLSQKHISLAWLVAGLAFLGAGSYLAVQSQWFPLDYDEVANAHSTWEMMQGNHIYEDFHEMHTPFFFMAARPLMRFLPVATESLLTLRYFSVALSIVLLGLLGFLISRELEGPSGFIATAMAMALMFLQPPVVQAMSEFRLDSLSCSTVLTGLCFMLGVFPNISKPATIFLGGFFLTIGMTIDAKLFVIPPLAAFLCGRGYVRQVAAGILSGLLFALLVCFSHGISITHLFGQVYGAMFHVSRLYNRVSLLHAIVHDAARQYMILTLLGVAGVSAIAPTLRQNIRKYPGIFILFCYCAITPLVVGFPFKQYVFSIYLFWAGPLALFVYKFLNSKYKTISMALFGVVFFSLLAFEAARFSQSRRSPILQQQLQFGNQILQLSPPLEPVAAQPPYHPVFRKNATFGWVESASPDGTEGAENIFGRIPFVGNRFTVEGYLADLSKKSPSVAILNPGTANKKYFQALTTYLHQVRKGDYRQIYSGKIEVYVREDLLSKKG